MKKINILQFLPYFPPHKGGLETVAKEFAESYIKNNFGEVINIITSFNQENQITENNKIIFEGETIGYKENGVENLIAPSFEIITNFPVYKIGNKKYKLIKKYLKTKKIDIIITHTRFFLTSFIGGLYARKNKIKWVHIEHGSDYVKLSSNLKNLIAKIYDKTLGKWIFKKADKLVGISNACKKFIQSKILKEPSTIEVPANLIVANPNYKNVDVIYRGVDFDTNNISIQEDLKSKYPGKILIGYVGRIVKLKGVDLLIDTFKDLNKKYNNIQLLIVGDGTERKEIEDKIKGYNLENIKLLGFKDKEYVKQFLKQIDILVNPSYQEGLPTSVIEGLLSNCVVVATNAGGTEEISDKEDLIIVEKGNVEELKKGLKKAINNYKKLSGLSKKEVKEKFNWDENIKKYYNLFIELVK